MKKWSVVFLVCFAMFCHAKDSSTNGNLSFVIDFLTKIHSEHKFTIQDEQKFLGMNGGVLGLYLENRLLSLNTMQLYNKCKGSVSFIGTLLQLKKKFLPDKSQVIYIGEMNDISIKKAGELTLEKLYGMTYIIVIGFNRRDVMSLDNKADVCIFAIYEKDKVPRIDLPHTIINGMRAPAVLGFQDCDNDYDMNLNSDDWEILMKTLEQQK